MPLRFHKVTGSGNDFVFLDGRETALDAWPAERIERICNRREGVGADGLVILEPAGESAVRMTYFNADGSRAGMCGNAALCSARLIQHLGLAPDSGVTLLTDTGPVETRCVGPGWMAELRLPDFRAPVDLRLSLAPGERRMASVVVGVPHLVVLVDDARKVDVASRGRSLRQDPRFGAAGTNVNFVSRTDGDGDCPWRMRTYERGVEGETLACGTGTVAVAFSLAQWGENDLPVRIRSTGGRTYSVSGDLKDGWGIGPWLCGEGRLVFSGTLEEDL
jgi:diaminopimelate epimerase